MNYFYLVAGIISLSCLVGHLVMGYPMYMRPVLNANLEEIPKRIMLSSFHYITVVFALTTLVFIAAGIRGPECVLGAATMRLFGVMYILWAAVQLIVGFFSNIQGSTFKMFQWVLFALMGLAALLGTCM